MSEWLELREPIDHASRSVELAAAFSNSLDADALVIDLGCGTGSNHRFLTKHGLRRRWLCVDHDRATLTRAEARVGGARVRFERRDLAQGLSSLPVGRGTAITTSAFLDLTSAAWLDELAERSRASPVLAAMSFDGRIAWQPAVAEDESIRLSWLAQQRGDSGFGPSLGPDAVGYLAERLREAGHCVDLAASDWEVASDHPALLEAVVQGIGRRVRAAAPSRALDRWLDLRSRQIAEGELRLLFGHVDLLSLPPAGSA